jgi:hypothetical protein
MQYTEAIFISQRRITFTVSLEAALYLSDFYEM